MSGMKSIVHVLIIMSMFLLMNVAVMCGLFGQEVEVPVKLQTELFLNVLAFDRNHRAPAGQVTILAVVYQAHFRRSVETKDEVLLAAGQKANIQVIPIDLEKGFLAELAQKPKPHMIIVCPLRSADIGDIIMFGRTEHILTAAFVSKYMEEGLSLCVQVERDRPVIMMNPEAAHNEHADFDSRLLKFIRTYIP